MIPVKCDTASLRISAVDEDIFRRKYFARCLSCHFCYDACCNYGCDVNRVEQERILSYRAELELLLGIPAERWFGKRIGKEADYPSGEFRRTRVHQGKCIFHFRTKRGCVLHQFALEKGADPHKLKPMVCSLFPLTWTQGKLGVSRFLNELPCREQGIPVFEAQKDELRAYMGTGFVSKLEGLDVKD